MAERAALLANCPLFAELSSQDRDSFAGIMTLRGFDPGEMLFMQGDVAEGFYIVCKGTLKVFRLGHDGREQVLHMIHRGEPCGEVPVFQGKNFPASAMAVVEAEVLYVPREGFLTLGAQHPELLLAILAVLSARLRQFVHLIEDLALKETSARLAKHLLDLRARLGDIVELETTKAVLATRLGTVAETLSRTLKKMQQRGIIAVDGRRIEILDPENLQTLSTGMKL